MNSEQFADGLLSEQELNDSRSLGCQAAQNEAVRQSRMRFDEANLVLVSRLTLAADTGLRSDHLAFKLTVSYPTSSLRADEKMKSVIPAILRDIFGNPFRSVSIDPSWLTTDVRSLAEGVYENRAFDRMPILADALQDAGCENEDVLNHCRRPGEHVRGCWVVDLLTGRK